jgi:ABC-2 type transport system permease protein
MPVSDWTTVLSKAGIPILVLPVVTYAVTVATHLVMLLAGTAVLAASGVSAAPLWTHVPLFKTAAINLVHLVGFHGIGYAPFYGWLLMVSAWAKRAPFLWAVLPPVAMGVVEKLAFDTSRFATMVQYRFMGGSRSATSEGGMTMDMLASDPIRHFFADPWFWVGLAVAAAFLFATVRLYRSRGPI